MTKSKGKGKENQGSPMRQPKNVSKHRRGEHSVTVHCGMCKIFAQKKWLPADKAVLIEDVEKMQNEILAEFPNNTLSYKVILEFIKKQKLNSLKR